MPSKKQSNNIADGNNTPNLQLATITPIKAATVPPHHHESHQPPPTATKSLPSTTTPTKALPVPTKAACTTTATTSKADFIGPSSALRHLFSLPYSTDRNVSVALHTLGNGTILLDEGVADFSGATNTTSAAACMGTTGDFGATAMGTPKPGRRRRPRSWSDQQQRETENNQLMGGTNQNQLVQIEGEKSLLASLSLLLEEERRLDDSKGGDENDGTEVNERTGTKVNEKVGAKVNVVESEAMESKADDGVKCPELAIVSLSARGETINNNQHCKNESRVSIVNPNVITSDTGPNIIMSSNAGPNKPMPTDPKDTLASKLHPPKHYLQHVMPPPSEPTQYLQWNFQGMNVLVASDVNIYTSEPTNTTHEGDSTYDNSKSIVVKVAETTELRSQMECYQQMVGAAVVPNLEQCKALPNSYADALLRDQSDEKKNAADANTTSLDNVKLQTCIPSFNVGSEFADFGFSISPSPATPSSDYTNENTSEPTDPPTPVPYSSTLACTVLNTYLDNIMSNVPQLALILREHGYIQNIKLMQTQDIPSLLMHPSLLDDTDQSQAEPIFSPEIVEMNAAMLLRFLKTNCTKENSTYLLHRSAGENLQLFDISSISTLRQRKWIWWLALCSYRFACRLEQLQTNVHDGATRRDYRKRQRSLLHNTLGLLEELADMDGGRHETIGAAVYEHLADTYLWNEGDVARDGNKPAPVAANSQPFGKVTVDCLNKAQDHLQKGIGVLNPLLVKAKSDESTIELEAISMQMYGMHHKLINVALRLADNHLQNYFSSNLVQSLRTAARTLSDATLLLVPLKLVGLDTEEDAYTESILLQYSWLWEYCGHFARSFAADELWRERGHTCGNDLLSLFREVDSACFSIMKNCLGSDWKAKSIVGVSSHGQVSLKSLTGIVVLPGDFEQIESSVLQKEGCHEAISTAKTIIYQQSQIKRDECLVLVAATLCYSHAIDAQRLARHSIESEVAPSLLFQRLGDACNEIGQILLKASRQVLVTGLPNEVVGRSSAIEKSHVSAIMLTSAQFWFLAGLEQFNVGNDLRNIALLRCNLCQVCKIRANANVILPGSALDTPNESEMYLQQAVDHLVLAHEAMGQRETDVRTWDMVSEELAATLLVLGVRRRQASIVGSSSSSSDPLTMNAFRPAPGVEKSIVEPMERACKIYESLGTPRSEQQAAAAHYQLAIYFSKVWTCQRDEMKTREKLASAFTHFGLAHHYYSYHTLGNEPTFVCLSLDFSNLYSAVSNREDCLVKALAICVDCRKAFISDSIISMRAKSNGKEWFTQMATLSMNLQDRVSKLLLSLVKIEKDRQNEDKYKNMYRQVISHKVMSTNQDSPNDVLCESFPIYDLLQDLAASLGIEGANAA